MAFGLTLLETGLTEHEIPIPAFGFGLIAFGLLIGLLLVTWSIGRGRPHS